MTVSMACISRNWESTVAWIKSILRAEGAKVRVLGKGQWPRALCTTVRSLGYTARVIESHWNVCREKWHMKDRAEALCVERIGNVKGCKKIS